MTAFRIEIPQDYFARIAAREYNDDAGLALVREFAQNAADAGAMNVRFDFKPESVLVISDDGSGCAADVVRTKLLTPLGTHKASEDAIGGFGKAKELLYFSNPRWTITTRDVRVVGSFLNVESFTTGNEHVNGFIAEVQLPPSLYNAARNAVQNFMRCSERPNVTWWLDGKNIACEVRRGKRCLRDLDFCKVYLDTTTSHDSVSYLRTGGLLTGMRWLRHNVGGRIIIEVTGRSADLLTPARDWFRAEEHRRAIDAWLGELATNASALLAERIGDEVFFVDHQPFDLDMTDFPKDCFMGPESVPQHEGTKASISFFGAPVAPACALEDLPVAAHEAIGVIERAIGGTPVERAEPKKAPKAPPKVFDLNLMPRVPGVARMAAHTGGRAFAKDAVKWLKRNEQEAFRLLAAWATAVAAVAKVNGLPIDAVGFTFAPHAEAEFLRTQGRFALLLNPTTLDMVSEDTLADELLDRALHETAHLVGSTCHDERFVSTESNLRRKTRGPTVRGVIARSLRLSEVVTLDAE